MPQDHDIVQRVLSAKGNSVLADQLISDYLPYILSETSRFTGRSVALGQDDEVSIAMIAFHRAIEEYSRHRGAFLGFASVVMKNQLIDYARKEGRHQGVVSLDQPAFSSTEEGPSLLDPVPREENQYSQREYRTATREEIQTLGEELDKFGVNLTDVADNCPRQQRTLEACRQAVSYCISHQGIVEDVRNTGRLPLARIVEATGISRKTLERHRRYILTLLLIYSNGYAIIRGHLKQVFAPAKGGRTQ